MTGAKLVSALSNAIARGSGPSTRDRIIAWFVMGFVGAILLSFQPQVHGYVSGLIIEAQKLLYIYGRLLRFLVSESCRSLGKEPLPSAFALPGQDSPDRCRNRLRSTEYACIDKSRGHEHSQGQQRAAPKSLRCASSYRPSSIGLRGGLLLCSYWPG